MTKSAPKPKIKITSPIKSLTGNSLTYFLPKTSSSQTVHKKTPGKNGLLIYKKPCDFIKKNFGQVYKLTLHHTGSLPPQCILRGVDIMRAALEGGYGRQNLWTSDLVMKPAEASDLASYLLNRLALVTSCLSRGMNNTLVVRAVYSHVETSEKAALSFIIGGLGSYIAAQQWLKTGGDGLDLFLHSGIYTKAVAGAGPLVKFSPSSKKSPDYLVYSDKKDWHVFESKGGSISERWLRIVQGLEQLATLPPIFWIGKEFPKSVKTAVCVHTSVDANKALKITVVDPPSENDEAEGVLSIGLIKSVCNILLILETIDQFRGLVGTSQTNTVRYGATSWMLGGSAVFGDFIVGIPSRYFDAELRIRRAIGIYLSAVEARSSSKNVGDFAAKFRRKLIGILRLDSNVTSVRFRRVIAFYISRIERFYDEPDFPLKTSQVLRLDAISESLMISKEEKVIAQLTSGHETSITSGGMLISGEGPVKAQRETE